MSKDLILIIYLDTRTVFSLHDLIKLFPHIPYNNLKRRLSYYVKTERLKKLRKNVYAKINYNPLEVPQKPYLPSYISLETVLEKEKIVPKKRDSIFSVSYISRTISIGGKKIVYRKLPEKILTNKKEIKETNGYFIASRERAFTDAVYIYKDYLFGNLKSLDWNKVMSLKKIYKNKVFEKRLDKYFQLAKKYD